LFGNTRIRAYGFLNLKDNAGNTGRVDLNRAGDISIQINAAPATHHTITKIMWMNIQLPAPQPA
jgi:hypothetical protein